MERRGTYINTGCPGLAEDIVYGDRTHIATAVVKNADVDHLIINNGGGDRQN